MHFKLFRGSSEYKRFYVLYLFLTRRLGECVQYSGWSTLHQGILGTGRFQHLLHTCQVSLCRPRGVRLYNNIHTKLTLWSQNQAFSPAPLIGWISMHLILQDYDYFQWAITSSIQSSTFPHYSYWVPCDSLGSENGFISLSSKGFAIKSRSCKTCIEKKPIDPCGKSRWNQLKLDHGSWFLAGPRWLTSTTYLD